MSTETLTPAMRVALASMPPKSIVAELRPAVDWSRVPIVDSRLLPPNDWTPPPADRQLSPTLRITDGVLTDENGAWVCPNCHEGVSVCGCTYQPIRTAPVRKPAAQRTPAEIVRDTNRVLAQKAATR